MQLHLRKKSKFSLEYREEPSNPETILKGNKIRYNLETETEF